MYCLVPDYVVGSRLAESDKRLTEQGKQLPREYSHVPRWAVRNGYYKRYTHFFFILSENKCFLLLLQVLELKPSS